MLLSKAADIDYPFTPALEAITKKALPEKHCNEPIQGNGQRLLLGTRLLQLTGLESTQLYISLTSLTAFTDLH